MKKTVLLWFLILCLTSLGFAGAGPADASPSTAPAAVVADTAVESALLDQIFGPSPLSNASTLRPPTLAWTCVCFTDSECDSWCRSQGCTGGYCNFSQGDCGTACVCG
ncbi:MAG: hypothetical protein ACJ76J_22640 [Thermoanaerobaculia bacterium]